MPIDGLEERISTAPRDLADLQRLHEHVLACSSAKWVVEREGGVFAAMGAPVVCFYDDPSVAVREGAVCVGSASDWGPVPLGLAAEYVAALHTALPALLAENARLRSELARLGDEATP